MLHLLLISSTKRCVHFLAKIELFKGNKKIFFKNLGIIPVDRKRKNPEAIEKANEYLKENKIIGIFPESTINKTDTFNHIESANFTGSATDSRGYSASVTLNKTLQIQFLCVVSHCLNMPSFICIFC